MPSDRRSERDNERTGLPGHRTGAEEWWQWAAGAQRVHLNLRPPRAGSGDSWTETDEALQRHPKAAVPGNSTRWRRIPVAPIQKYFGWSGRDWKLMKKLPIPCKFCTSSGRDWKLMKILPIPCKFCNYRFISFPLLSTIRLASIRRVFTVSVDVLAPCIRPSRHTVLIHPYPSVDQGAARAPFKGAD